MKNVLIKGSFILLILLMPFGMEMAQGAGLSWSKLTSGLPASFRVTAIEVSPSNPSIIYAGIQGTNNLASLVRSIDGGTTWNTLSVPYNTQIKSSVIKSIAVNPQNSATVFITMFDDTMYYATGLFKSTNSGQSFTRLSPHPRGMAAPWDFVSIDSRNPSVVYTGHGAAGLMKSTDGGSTWATISTDFMAGNATIAYFAINPQNTSNIFYANSGYNIDYPIFKSINGGSSWLQIAPLKRFSIYSITIDPLSSDSLYVGAAYSTATGAKYGLYKSSNGGNSWSFIDFKSELGLDMAWTYSIVSSNPSVYAGVYGKGVFRSVDGGETWENAGTGLFFSTKSKILLAMSSTNVLYAGTDAGIFKASVGTLPPPPPPSDNPPIADAGAPQIVDSGDFVSLDGSASYDPDGTSVSYQWRQLSGPTVSLAGANTVTPTFMSPAVLSQTNLNFELKVTSNSLYDTDTTAVTVMPPLAPPGVDDVTVGAVITSKNSCTMTVKLRATSTLQPTARLTYVVKNGQTTKSGKLSYSSTYKVYTAYVYSLPIGPYTVEVQSDAGGEATTAVGAYNTPSDVGFLDVNVTYMYESYGKDYFRIWATSSQQPYACLNYQLVNTRTGATVKQGRLYYSSTKRYYYTSAYLYPDTYRLKVWSTYGGSATETFTVE